MWDFLAKKRLSVFYIPWVLNNSYHNFFLLIKTWSFGPVANPATRGSEKHSYAEGGSYLNPKHEILNPKRFGRLAALSNVEGQYLMIQIRIIKTRHWRYNFKYDV